MTKHIIRWLLSLSLIVTIFFNAHWSVGLFALLLTLESEVSAWVFVRNTKEAIIIKEDKGVPSNDHRIKFTFPNSSGHGTVCKPPQSPPPADPDAD